MYALRWCTEEPGKLVSIAQTYSLLFPSARTPKVCGCVRNKDKRKCQNHSTQDSRVVPHRGTNWAALWLTSQIGRDAVLSESYGRGYWFSAESGYVPIFFDLPVTNFVTPFTEAFRLAFKRAEASVQPPTYFPYQIQQKKKYLLHRPGLRPPPQVLGSLP